MNKMSASAAFMGTSITQEDIMNTTLSRIYKAIKGSEQTVNGIPCYCIELEPRIADAAYLKILVYIQKDSGLLLKREYYSYTGDLIKKMNVLDYRVGKAGYEYLKVSTETIGTQNSSVILTFEQFNRNAVIDPKLFEVNRLQYVR